MALVEIKHLKKYYNTPRGLLHAIDDVTMDIEKGKTIGIVGESGCGKSTLGKTLIRMEDATDGEVYFDGTEVTHMSQHEFKNMRMRICFSGSQNERFPADCRANPDLSSGQK